jgi:RNA polymerase sigma-70 factor (ECF subfamily)
MMQRFSQMWDQSSNSSIDLVVRAQAGDDDALNRLLERYLPRLRRWASARMPASGRTMLETGDIVQEAVTRALRHLNTFEVRHEGALFAYFRQAVQNRIIDYARSRQRRPDRGEMPEHARSEETSPLDAAVGAEAQARYEAALARLSDHDRQLVVLRVEAGEEYDAIAMATSKPSTAAARMACARAIARLAQEMRRDG